MCCGHSVIILLLIINFRFCELICPLLLFECGVKVQIFYGLTSTIMLRNAVLKAANAVSFSSPSISELQTIKQNLSYNLLATRLDQSDES